MLTHDRFLISLMSLFDGSYKLLDVFIVIFKIYFLNSYY